MNIIEITNLENRWCYRYVRASCMLLEHLKPDLCNYRGPFTKHFYWVLTSFLTNLCEITVGSHLTLYLVTNRVLPQLHRHLLYQQLQLSLLNAVVGIATSTHVWACANYNEVTCLLCDPNELVAFGVSSVHRRVYSSELLLAKFVSML